MGTTKDETPENDSPEWAKKRAVSLANAEAGFATWRSVENSSGMRAFAKYIAEHEEPPVDPLLLEARKIVAEQYPTEEAKRDVMSGADDFLPDMKIAIAALKRGIEIAEEE